MTQKTNFSTFKGKKKICNGSEHVECSVKKELCDATESNIFQFSSFLI